MKSLANFVCILILTALAADSPFAQETGKSGAQLLDRCEGQRWLFWIRCDDGTHSVLRSYGDLKDPLGRDADRGQFATALRRYIACTRCLSLRAGGRTTRAPRRVRHPRRRGTE